MLTAFQESSYERRHGLCLCEEQSQFALPGDGGHSPPYENGFTASLQAGAAVLDKANLRRAGCAKQSQFSEGCRADG